MNIILDLGVRFVVAIQGLGSWMELPMNVFSFLGTKYFLMLLLLILYWCVDSGLGIRVAFILMVSLGVNDSLKLVFHGPRPYWYSTSVKRLVDEASFGVPSGHAQNAFSIWGMLASGLRKRWTWWVAGVLIFLIGFSRLYLGVHFPHDVLIGWLVGALLLWFTIRFWDPVAAWAVKLSLGSQILFAFLAALVVILVEAIPYFLLLWTNWQPPQLWAQYATGAATLSGAFTSGGTFFGLLSGLALMRHQGGFKTSGAWGKRVLRFVLGVIGVLIFYVGLDVLFGLMAPDAEAALPFFLRFVRYMLVGAWVSAGAPWLFVRFKLAEKAV